MNRTRPALLVAALSLSVLSALLFGGFAAAAADEAQLAEPTSRVSGPIGPSAKGEESSPLALRKGEGPGTPSLLRLALGLVVVLALMLGLLYLLRRLGYGQASGGGEIEILASRSLGPRERVVLVRTGRRHVLVGVASGRVAALDQWTSDQWDQTL